MKEKSRLKFIIILTIISLGFLGLAISQTKASTYDEFEINYTNQGTLGSSPQYKTTYNFTTTEEGTLICIFDNLGVNWRSQEIDLYLDNTTQPLNVLSSIFINNNNETGYYEYQNLEIGNYDLQIDTWNGSGMWKSSITCFIEDDIGDFINISTYEENLINLSTSWTTTDWLTNVSNSTIIAHTYFMRNNESITTPLLTLNSSTINYTTTLLGGSSYGRKGYTQIINESQETNELYIFSDLEYSHSNDWANIDFLTFETSTPPPTEFPVITLEEEYNCGAGQSCIYIYNYNELYIPDDANEISIYDSIESTTPIITTSIENTESIFQKNSGTSYFAFLNPIEINTTTTYYARIESETISALYPFNVKTTVAEIELIIEAIQGQDDLAIQNMVCSESEWAEADGTFFNFMRLKCSVFYSSVKISYAIGNILKGIVNSIITIAEHIFPFNIVLNIQNSWNDAQAENLPTELEFLNIADENGNIYISFPSGLNGTETNSEFLAWGDDIFIQEGSSSISIFSYIKILSKYIFWFMFIFGIIRTGREIYQNISSKETNSIIKPYQP